LLKQQAEQHLFTIQSQLQTEITTAYASYKLQQQNVQNFQIILEQSQTILDNVKYAYLKGGTTIIDFLEAQRSWLETQQQYYDALQQYRQSYIQLLYATGLINQLAL
jgi:cobalt-zinc-cadmium efflux system outer membrane protein